MSRDVLRVEWRQQDKIFPADHLLLASLVCKLRAEDGDEVDDDEWAAKLRSW